MDATCDAVSCQGGYSNLPAVCLTHMHNDLKRSHDDAGLMHSAVTADVHCVSVCVCVCVSCM